MALAQPAHARRSATQEGIPVARYVPAPSGPPVTPDLPPPMHLSPAGWGSRSAADGRGRARGRREAAVTERGVRSRRLAIVLMSCLALALMVWRLNGSPFNPLAAISAPRAVTAAPACPIPPVDATAAHTLTAPRLASALRDAAHGDYRPAIQAVRFVPGQPAYLTFKITTNASGTADVLFCLPSAHITGALTIPSGSLNRYGQFSATFTPSEVGTGEAILRWNGRVAAVLPLTVTRAGGR